jgi:DnaJ like chaperone protein
MRMFLVVIGALLGALFGGFTGLLVGAALGYAAGAVLRQSVVGGLRVVQSQLIDSTFAVMGAVCKADNVVTRDEINAVEKIFTMLRLQEEQRRAAKDAFNRGKQPGFDLDSAVDRFARVSRRRAPLVQLFLQLQVMAVAADGRVHPAEHAMLVRVARRLGLQEHDVAQLEALLRAGGAGPSAPGAPPAADRLADAYAALGVSPDASPAEIKRAYRKLISQNHPDKLAARGLPESMRAVAEERSREINAAYDLIKDARGIV